MYRSLQFRECICSAMNGRCLLFHLLFFLIKRRSSRYKPHSSGAILPASLLARLGSYRKWHSSRVVFLRRVADRFSMSSGALHCASVFMGRFFRRTVPPRFRRNFLALSSFGFPYLSLLSLLDASLFPPQSAFGLFRSTMQPRLMI